MLILQHYHKVVGHRSSGLSFTFWFFLMFCSAPQFRYEIRNFNTASIDEMTWEGFRFLYYMTFFSSITIMMLLSCFSDKPPRNSTFVKYERPCPELEASFLRKIFYQWFTKTTWTGWRRPLLESDVYDINPDDACAELFPPFEKYFEESVKEQKLVDV